MASAPQPRSTKTLLFFFLGYLIGKIPLAIMAHDGLNSQDWLEILSFALIYGVLYFITINWDSFSRFIQNKKKK